MPLSENMTRNVHPAKPRVFLADLEFAKKEEWERRRKLRLKQVRQQARDIATTIRTQAIKARRRNEIISKCKNLNAELVAENNKKKELECELSECLSSVGAAHSSATILTEADELVRDRTELQDKLARVRAELSAEKTKDTRKSRSEVVENLREGTSISKVASNKPPVQPAIKKYFPALNPSHSVPPTPPNFCSHGGRGDGYGNGEFAFVQPLPEKTSSNPKTLTNVKPNRVKANKDDSCPDGRKSCPPVMEVVDESSDSDSGQTWPPASVTKKKSSKVRMYDHSARKCSEYVRQCGVVRMDTPEGMDMKELIQDEEQLLAKKTDEELEQRRIDLHRGVRALREEIAKQDWDSAINKLCHFAKEKRIKKSLEYPNPANREELQTCDSDLAPLDVIDHDVPLQSADKDIDQPEAPDTRQQLENKKKGPKLPKNSLSSIVRRFNRQREAVLKDQSLASETGESDNEDDDDAELPSWLKAEVENQSTARESQSHPERIGTPETVMGNMRSSSSSLCSSNSDENAEPTSSSHAGPAEKIDIQAESQKIPTPSKESGDSSSNDVDVEIRFSKGSSSSRGSFVENERASQEHDKLLTPVKGSSSTSYCSPPDKLSPQQLTLLRGILSRMTVKNRNPVLHRYINRVLEMSRQSVSELDVSSASELSVQSDLFKKRQSSVGPRRHLPVNSSTAVTVSNTPQDSVRESSSSDNAAEIANLLRNILELQRLYRSATSSDPFSDSLSSYRSVPHKIGDDRCDHANPEFVPLANFCEETGIFEGPLKTDERPLNIFATLDKGEPKIDIPSELFPKPVFASSDHRIADHINRHDKNVTDGYAMRSEHSPIPAKVATRGIQKVINSLSDIESEVSSIQSTPTKILSRRSTSRASVVTIDSDSTVSGLSSSDFISSTQLQNNDLIHSSDSTSGFEDVFQSLGIGWALTTLRRIRNAKKLPADDSTDVNSATTSSSNSKNPPSYRHSTPVKPQSCPKPVLESSENDAIPSLTPPNLTLLCPTLQKSSHC